MRAVVQRVLSASVSVGDEVVGRLDRPGLLVYLGVTHDDGAAEIAWVARKVWELRLLREERSASEVGAPILVVGTSRDPASPLLWAEALAAQLD